MADAMGVTTARHLRRHPGDAHGERRKVTALVTDGVIRDKAGCPRRPTCRSSATGTAAPASVNGLTFVGWNEPIACGGVRDLSRRHDCGR